MKYRSPASNPVVGSLADAPWKMPWKVARSLLADVAEVDAEDAELADADALEAAFAAEVEASPAFVVAIPAWVVAVEAEPDAEVAEALPEVLLLEAEDADAALFVSAVSAAACAVSAAA